jgi:hypothetical protein
MQTSAAEEHAMPVRGAAQQSHREQPHGCDQCDLDAHGENRKPVHERLPF